MARISLPFSGKTTSMVCFSKSSQQALRDEAIEAAHHDSEVKPSRTQFAANLTGVQSVTHPVASGASKPLLSWLPRPCFQEAKEIKGGRGSRGNPNL
jgi:hypothetical protein